MVMSAVSSVSTPGVLVTRMLRFRAVSRSILSTPVPNWAISLSCGPAWLSTRPVDAVGHGRHQHVGGLHRLDQLFARKRLVFEIEPRVEQLAQARFHHVGQLARDNNERSFSTSHYVIFPFGCARGRRSPRGQAIGAPKTGARRLL